MKVQQTKKINDSIVQHGLNVSLDQTICLNLTNNLRAGKPTTPSRGCKAISLKRVRSESWDESPPF